MMRDEDKTREQLISELRTLRDRVPESQFAAAARSVSDERGGLEGLKGLEPIVHISWADLPLMDEVSDSDEPARSLSRRGLWPPIDSGNFSRENVGKSGSFDLET